MVKCHNTSLWQSQHVVQGTFVPFVSEAEVGMYAIQEENYMNDTVDFVVTESAWDRNFDEALKENRSLLFTTQSGSTTATGPGKWSLMLTMQSAKLIEGMSF
ncbi:hypothetical protein BSL78_23404 [Apostichopus japonicus]|uniref:Uncharacterized protein n=1 Tax=Stichopus japonicus TaxID=307972 RepID=A0A2G8JVF6_STIJA|nr:hypothetical protein BSL78_23404 [Apostichopus japonicus]